MLLNDYLRYALGANIEKKYNRKAVEEVLLNSREYLDIQDCFDEFRQMIETSDFRSDIFTKEKSEFHRDLVLYRAFAKVICEDALSKDVPVTKMDYGVYYMYADSPDESIYPLNCCVEELSVTKDAFIVHIENSEEETKGAFPFLETDNAECAADNTELLKEISHSVLNGGILQAIDGAHFNDSEGYLKNASSDNDCYGYYGYYFYIGKNVIPVFTKDFGFDGLTVARNIISRALPERIKSSGAYSRLSFC